MAQAARVLRQTTDRDDEHVCLLTDALPKELDAQKWLQLNRGGFGGIENGLHQRLDASHNDDRCRMCDSKGIRIVGMFRRLANSLFMQWRSHQPHPEYKTTTDFQAAMSEDHRRAALRIVRSKRPNFAFTYPASPPAHSPQVQSALGGSELDGCFLPPVPDAPGLGSPAQAWDQIFARTSTAFGLADKLTATPRS